MLKNLLFTFHFSLFTFLCCAQTQTFTVTSTWVAPYGVTSVKAQCWGSGGGGGAGKSFQYWAEYLPGDGGNGGDYAGTDNIAVTPGKTYTVIVGTGGLGQLYNEDIRIHFRTPGDSSSFTGDNLTVTAAGGGGRVGNSGSDGSIIFSGGIGATTNKNLFYNLNMSGTGAGGGGAGPGGNGNVGESTRPYYPYDSGGKGGVPDGGNGGFGNTNPCQSAGMFPGGGGGGGRASLTGPCWPVNYGSGGNGANGQVKLTWIAYTPPSVLANVIANVSCNSGNNGSDSATPSGGTSPYTYLWSDPNSQTTNPATGLTAGSYTITVTDNVGATATASVTITQPATALTITMATNTDASCNGGTGVAIANAAIGGTSPYTYNWTPSGGSNLIVTNLSAGTYTITATDNNGCTATASVTITQPAFPLAITMASQTNVLCNGTPTGSATANAATGGTAPYTYNWSPNGGTNLMSPNLSAGTYTITATDNHGCTAITSVIITQPAPLTISIAGQTNIPCFGHNSGRTTAYPASGGTAPYKYLWTSSEGTYLEANNLSAGTYTITATDSNNCTATASVTITQPATALTITMASQTNILCNGGTGSATANAATGGTAPYTYSWSPSGGTNLTASNLSAGIYAITATDNGGCYSTVFATITQPAAALAVSIASQTNILCNGGTGNAIANAATGGVSPYTYMWSDANTQTTLSATALSAGTYTITATDNNACIITASVTISQPLAVTANVSVNTNATACSESGSASVASGGGTPPYIYLWTGGINSDTATGLSAGTYTVTVTDSNGCTGSSSITITAPSAMSFKHDSISIIGSANCNGEAAVAVKSGGTAPYTYLWSPNNQTTDTIKNQCVGVYCCKVTDNTGCSQTTCVTVKSSTGINELKFENGELIIYPDPSKGVFQLGIKNYELGIKTVEVYNMLGEKVYSAALPQTPKGALSEIDLTKQPDGVYLIRILTKDGTLVVQQKIVKAR